MTDGPGQVPSPWLYGASLSLSYSAGGIVLGVPTGGQMGAGTINVAGGFYVNGVTLPGAFGSQTANTIYAAPNGSSGTPIFRAIANGDLPSSIALAGTLGITGQTTLVNLAATGVVSGAGFINYLAAPPNIGGTTPAAAAFTSLSASIASTIAGIPFNPSTPVQSTFAAPNQPGILLTSGTPFYISGTPTAAGQDTPAGVLYVSKYANYTGIPTSSTPVIYALNNVAAGAQGTQIGVLGNVFNANTLTSQPSGSSGAVGIYGIGTCGVAGGTATWGGLAAAYDTSGQVNPPNSLVGLEVDVYANGTDSGLQRIGVQIVSGRPGGTGPLNTTGRGIFLGGIYTNLIDGGTATAVNGLTLAGMTLSGAAINSPGFQVDNVGNIIAKMLTTAAATTAHASINLPQGSAPTSPNNGDIWMTSAGLFYRFNATTHGPL